MSDQKQPLEDQGQSFAVGAVVGALVGGIAAMLLTPKSGKEMRSIAKDYAKEWEGEAGDLAVEAKQIINTLKQALEESAEQVGQRAPEVASQATHKAAQAVETLEDTYVNSRDTVSEMVETFRSQWQELEEEQQSKQAASRFRGVNRSWELDSPLNDSDKENVAYVEELQEEVEEAALAPRQTLAQYRQAARSNPEEEKKEPVKKTPESKEVVRAKSHPVPVKPVDDEPKKAKKPGRKLLFRKAK